MARIGVYRVSVLAYYVVMKHSTIFARISDVDTMSHPTSDRRENSWHYISMGSSQPSRRVLKP